MHRGTTEAESTDTSIPKKNELGKAKLVPLAYQLDYHNTIIVENF